MVNVILTISDLMNGIENTYKHKTVKFSEKVYIFKIKPRHCLFGGDAAFLIPLSTLHIKHFFATLRLNLS